MVVENVWEIELTIIVNYDDFLARWRALNTQPTAEKTIV